MSRAALASCRKPDQRSCAVHQLSPQIAITTLANAEQPFPATGRMLARGEAEPRGKAAAAVEELRVTDRRHHRRGDHRADARDSVNRLAASSLRAWCSTRRSSSAILVSIARRCST